MWAGPQGGGTCMQLGAEQGAGGQGWRLRGPGSGSCGERWRPGRGAEEAAGKAGRSWGLPWGGQWRACRGPLGPWAPEVVVGDDEKGKEGARWPWGFWFGPWEEGSGALGGRGRGRHGRDRGTWGITVLGHLRGGPHGVPTLWVRACPQGALLPPTLERASSLPSPSLFSPLSPFSPLPCSLPPPHLSSSFPLSPFLYPLHTSLS